jgi:hypothetical protein
MRNLPAGRRFHSRTFRSGPYQPHLHKMWKCFTSWYAIVKYRVSPWVWIKKPRSRGKLKSRVIQTCYDACSWFNLINTYRPFYRKQNKSQAFNRDTYQGFYPLFIHNFILSCLRPLNRIIFTISSICSIWTYPITRGLNVRDVFSRWHF